MTQILIRDIIQSPLAISSGDAEKLYTKLREELKCNNQIELSFDGIDDFISSFLNASIGKLYNKEFDYNFLDQSIEVKGLDTSDMNIFSKVIERAKSYYTNPHHFDEVKNELNNE